MHNKVPRYITDWMKFEAFLKDLLAFTEGLIKSLEQKDIDYEYQRVLYKFLQRFHLNFITIRNTWKEYLNNSKFKYPFYLLLRSLVSDYIIMLYLIEGLKFENETGIPVETEFRNRYIEISNSYFTRVDREMDKLIADTKLTAKQKERFLKAEREFYPEHFEIGEKIKVKKISNLDPGTLVRKLKNGNYKEFVGIYQYYFYFSQYEHFTVKSEELLGNWDEEEFVMLTDSVDYLIRGLHLNIVTMQLDKEILKKLTSVINGFEERFRI